MLRLKDLTQRKYTGRVCTYFEVQVRTGEAAPGKPQSITARFAKQEQNANQWQMQVVLQRTRDKDHDVYQFDYVMPKADVPLELIAATGLKYFQLYLKDEIEGKQLLDFCLGDVLEGM